MQPARRRVLLRSLSLLLAGPVLAQTDFSQVEVKTRQLTPGTYMLSGAGGNLGSTSSARIPTAT